MRSTETNASHGREVWLYGRSVDLLVGCGLGYLIAVPPLLYYGLTTGTTDWPIFFVVGASMLLNAPHYGATLLRVYEEREERHRYAFFAVYVTAALAVALFSASYSVLVASLLITAYVTWSPWHFSGQNYGLALLFLRRRGVDVDPRAMLGFEDEVMKLEEIDDTPPHGYTFPLLFTWTLPPLPEPPDLLVLATDLAGIGGIDLPVEVSAIDSFPTVTDAPERSLSIVAKMVIDLADVYMNADDAVIAALERCKHVSLYLLDRAPAWLGEF